jgi:hypothetical protein
MHVVTFGSLVVPFFLKSAPERDVEIVGSELRSIALVVCMRTLADDRQT